MNDIKKIILVLVALFMTAVVPSFSQTADVRYAGVFYKTPSSQAGGDLVKQMYCDFAAGAAQPGTTVPTWYTENIPVKVPPALNTTVQDGTLSVRFLGTNVNAAVSTSATLRQPSTNYSINDYYFISDGFSTYYFQVLSGLGSSSGASNATFLNNLMVSFDASATGQNFPDGGITVKFLGKDVSAAVAGAAADRLPYHHYAVGEYYRVAYYSYFYYFEVMASAGAALTENILNPAWVSGHFGTYTFLPFTNITDGNLSLTRVSSCAGASARSSSTYYSVGDVYSLSGGAQNTTQCYQVTSVQNAFTFGPIAANNASNRSFVSDPDPSGNQNNTDPWVSSALIEYDQPYPQSADPTTNNYPNHCLALCMNVKCSNKPLGGSTYSISFPLQNVKFDVVKYYNNKNVENAEETPAVRTIDLYPTEGAARCGSYRCPGAAASGLTCNSATSYCEGSVSNHRSGLPGAYLYSSECTGTCKSFSPTDTPNCTPCGTGAAGIDTGGVCSWMVWNNDGTKSDDNTGIPFCAAWDGSYEIAGEFGKTNGQFAFRATVSTDVPG